MENEENKPISKNVETYTDDMVKALGESKGGLIKKIIHEEEKHNSEKKNLSPKSKKNKLFLAISIILVLAALLIVLFLLFFNRKVSVPIKPQFSSVIFVDKTDFKPIDNFDFKKDNLSKIVFNQIKNTPVKIGGIYGVYLIKNNQTISFRDFINLTKSNLTENDVGLFNDDFLLGVVNDTGLPVPEINPSGVKIETEPVDLPLSSPIVKEGKLISLNSSVFFKTGTTDFLDTEAKDKAKNAIVDFLDGVDFLTSKINVVGTYSVERPWDKNDSIAEERRKLGIDILNEVLSGKYSDEEISKIIIESSARGVSIKDIYSEEEIYMMTPEELSDAIDGTQGIQYLVQAKTKTEIINSPVPDGSEVDTDAEEEVSSILDFFILLKVNSFSEIFPVMHAWEGKMLYDLHGFFGVDITPETNNLFTKNFEDGIVENKNTRALYDDMGNTVLMYVFLDDTSVIITDSVNATKEVLLRLNSSQIKK